MEIKKNNEGETPQADCGFVAEKEVEILEYYYSKKDKVFCSRFISKTRTEEQENMLDRAYSLANAMEGATCSIVRKETKNQNAKEILEILKKSPIYPKEADRRIDILLQFYTIEGEPASETTCGAGTWQRNPKCFEGGKIELIKNIPKYRDDIPYEPPTRFVRGLGFVKIPTSPAREDYNPNKADM